MRNEDTAVCENIADFISFNNQLSAGWILKKSEYSARIFININKSEYTVFL